MKVQNLRIEAAFVVLYVNGRPGPTKMVMKDTPEELYGPVYMKGSDGQDIHMTVPGEMAVAYPGAQNASDLICLDYAPVSKSWIDGDGVRYTLEACDYRYRPPQRQSR